MIVRIIGDGSSYQKMVKTAVDSTDRAAKQLQKSSKDAEVFGKTLDGLGTHMSNFAGQMRALAALQSPISFIYDSVRKAAESEKLESSFGTMLQSAAKGKQLVADIQQLAAATPLNQADLQQGAQTLLQFNVAAKDLIPTMRMLGDVTNGDAERLRRMVLAFGQMKATGRLMGQDLMQMVNAGFNPLQEIFRTTGVSVIELKQQMEKGLLTTKMVEDAFLSATTGTGHWKDGMENASKTLSGLFSTMQDDIDAAKRTVGAYIIESFHLKEALQEVSKAAQRFTEWFTNLDPEMKKAITSIAILLASFAALLVVWKVGAIILGIVVGVMKDMVVTARWLAGTINILKFSFSGLFTTLKAAALTALAWAPYVAIFAVIIGVIGMVVEEMGGFEASFEFLKAAAKDALEWIERKFYAFNEWIRPVTDALESLGTTAWIEFKANAHDAWNWVKKVVADGMRFIEDAWTAIGGEGIGTWEDIRTEAQRAILLIEYSLTHVEDVSDVVWKGILYGAVLMSNGILDVTFKTFMQIGEGMFNVVTELGNMIAAFVEDPTQGLKFDWEKILKTPITDETMKFSEILGSDKLEKDLKKDLDAAKRNVLDPFDVFYKKKLAEFAAFQPTGKSGRWAIWGQVWKETLDGAEKTTDAVKNLTHEIHRFDAALFGSAESKARIAAFKDMAGATKRATSINTSGRLQTVPWNDKGWEIANQLGAGVTGQAKPRDLTLNEKGWAWLAQDASKDLFGQTAEGIRGGKMSQDLKNKAFGLIGEEGGKMAGDAAGARLAAAIENLNRMLAEQAGNRVSIILADLEK